MGKGGYNGGSSIIRASRGYVSTPGKKSPSGAPLTLREKRARKTAELMQSGNVVSLEEARILRLPKSMWRVRCEKNVKIIERDLSNAKRDLKILERKIDSLRHLLKTHEGYRQAFMADQEEPDNSEE